MLDQKAFTYVLRYHVCGFLKIWQKYGRYTWSNKCHFFDNKTKKNNLFKNFLLALPFGIPHGGLVRIASKKSKSYWRAGGNVRPTWAQHLLEVKARMIPNRRMRPSMVFAIFHWSSIADIILQKENEKNVNVMLQVRVNKFVSFKNSGQGSI